MRAAKIVIITVFVVVLVEVLSVEIFIRAHRFTAKEKPSWLESTLAQHARNISVPSDARALTNPRAVSDEIMAEAREHWTEHCAVCHGIDGSGGTTVGRGMYPPAPDMKDPKTQQKSDGELFYIISNGVRLTGMPAWAGEDSPESIWDLVSFIRHLPQLTPKELKQMKEISSEADADDKEGQPSEEPKPGTEVESVGHHRDKPGTKPHKHTHEHPHEDSGKEQE
jgi:mono/diheme cytochrome c family protein